MSEFKLFREFVNEDRSWHFGPGEYYRDDSEIPEDIRKLLNDSGFKQVEPYDIDFDNSDGIVYSLGNLLLATFPGSGRWTIEKANGDLVHDSFISDDDIRHYLKQKKYILDMLVEDGTGKLHPDHKATIPYGDWYHRSSAYDHYRLGISCSVCTDKEEDTPKDFQAYGPYGEHPFSVGYSEEDEKILNNARKLCGLDVKNVASGRSKEPDHVHKVSPVNANPHKKPWRNR